VLIIVFHMFITTPIYRFNRHFVVLIHDLLNSSHYFSRELSLLCSPLVVQQRATLMVGETYSPNKIIV